MDAVLTALLSHGPLGLLCGALLLLYVRRDRELRTESAARIEDAKAALALALQMQKGLLDAIDKIAEIEKELRRRGPYRG